MAGLAKQRLGVNQPVKSSTAALLKMRSSKLRGKQAAERLLPFDI